MWNRNPKLKDTFKYDRYVRPSSVRNKKPENCRQCVDLKYHRRPRTYKTSTSNNNKYVQHKCNQWDSPLFHPRNLFAFCWCCWRTECWRLVGHGYLPGQVLCHIAQSSDQQLTRLHWPIRTGWLRLIGDGFYAFHSPQHETNVDKKTTS